MITGLLGDDGGPDDGGGSLTPQCNTVCTISTAMDYGLPGDTSVGDALLGIGAAGIAIAAVVVGVRRGWQLFIDSLRF